MSGHPEPGVRPDIADRLRHIVDHRPRLTSEIAEHHGLDFYEVVRTMKYLKSLGVVRSEKLAPGLEQMVWIKTREKDVCRA